ncbi:branched-chain amino acid ABC transporter permease [Agrobacterium leguminum]|uniref:Branched-chain amino acid ABC transporter permease n=1 Tax=Agrobacterium leguminum TaxID=2792015 RepID=A0A9X3KGU0_9HYPH|nr:branched-chain amino acid ABC transporter permease [Agrobacterium leguminum]MCZ7911458.1 branched-chain amino acid ABC transporter permease [Agrobacterium leguminum]
MLQLILDFLWAFSALALISLSLGLIMGELKIVNIAQGDMVMVGAYCMYAMRDMPFLAALGSTVVIGLCLGFILERFVLRWVYHQGFIATLLATWGIGLVLQQLVSVAFSISQKGVDMPVTTSVEILGVTYPLYRLLAGAGMLTIVGLVILLVYKTNIGLRIRASIDNVEMASVLGIAPQHVFTLVFAIASAMALLAGALVAPTLSITPTMGLSFIAPAFFSVLIAREGSILGPILGASIVQLLLIILRWQFQVTIADGILFALLVIIVTVWPRGIAWKFKKRGRSHGTQQT